MMNCFLKFQKYDLKKLISLYACAPTNGQCRQNFTTQIAIHNWKQLWDKGQQLFTDAYGEATAKTI